MIPVYGSHPTELSPPTAREEVHNRRISCNGFVRTDGLYDIEAEMTDHKTYSFPSDFRGDVTPEMPLHHMKVRVTVNANLRVVAAEAVTVAGPYALCPTANDVFTALVGLQIGPGWRRKVAAAIGGRQGCTHITELMASIATIAYQTRYGEASRNKRAQTSSDTSSDTGTTDANTPDAQASQSRKQTINSLANSCVAYATEI